jgi:hypothetical protein
LIPHLRRRCKSTIIITAIIITATTIPITSPQLADAIGLDVEVVVGGVKVGLVGVAVEPGVVGVKVGEEVGEPDGDGEGVVVGVVVGVGFGVGVGEGVGVGVGVGVEDTSPRSP